MQPKKILIIEDNPMNLELARDLLELAGFVVLDADSASDGIALAKSARPDLILMDLDLPDMTGFEATEKLKSDPTTAGITVVALSAHAMREEQEKAIASGCRGFLTKPIDTRVFWTQVLEFLPGPGGR